MNIRLVLLELLLPIKSLDYLSNKTAEVTKYIKYFSKRMIM